MELEASALRVAQPAARPPSSRPRVATNRAKVLAHSHTRTWASARRTETIYSRDLCEPSAVRSRLHSPCRHACPDRRRHRKCCFPQCSGDRIPQSVDLPNPVQFGQTGKTPAWLLSFKRESMRRVILGTAAGLAISMPGALAFSASTPMATLRQPSSISLRAPARKTVLAMAR